MGKRYRSGKSFAAKREILNVFLVTNDDVIVCDPEAEYYALVQALGGQVIHISSTSKDYINPMSETRLENKAGLSFSLRRGRLMIYHATIKKMGEPKYIRFLLNTADGKLAVQCCEEIDGNNFRVPDNNPDAEFKFEICSVTFLSLLYKKCRWDDTKTYACYGTYHPKFRLVEFDLSQAREIRPEQFIDPENM